jgi:uncharacterized protein (DUF2141 family)
MMSRFLFIPAIFTTLAGFLPLPALSSTLSVAVKAPRATEGQLGCALYASAEGFPMVPEKAERQWYPATPEGVTCVYTNLKPGVYAVAVSHDTNGNKVVDTNLLGIPVEGWGVSNNVRPTLRAPKFDEAAFQVNDDTSIQVRVK